MYLRYYVTIENIYLLLFITNTINYTIIILLYTESLSLYKMRLLSPSSSGFLVGRSPRRHPASCTSLSCESFWLKSRPRRSMLRPLKAVCKASRMLGLLDGCTLLPRVVLRKTRLPQALPPPWIVVARACGPSTATRFSLLDKGSAPSVFFNSTSVMPFEAPRSSKEPRTRAPPG